jgi:hypothetical protein
MAGRRRARPAAGLPRYVSSTARRLRRTQGAKGQTLLKSQARAAGSRGQVGSQARRQEVGGAVEQVGEAVGCQQDGDGARQEPRPVQPVGRAERLGP